MLSLIGLVVAIAVLPAAPVDAVAAAPAPPSEVTLSWGPGGPDAFSFPLVTWTGGGPGEVRWRIDELVAGEWRIGGEQSPAPGPVITIGEAQAFCCDRVFRVGVWFVDGGVAGEAAFSPVFDTQAPQRPIVTSVQGWIDGRIKYTWTASPLEPDTTPGDPLDVPGPPKYAVVMNLTLVNEGPRAMAVTTGTTATLAWQVSSTAVVEANEWTFSPSLNIYALAYKRPIGWLGSRGGRVTASTPAVATYGLPMTITGLAEERVHLACWNDECDHTYPSPSRRVVLHARRDASSPWVGVTSGLSDSQGRFAFRVTAPGTRQYRVALLGVPYPQSSITYVGATSSPTTTITKTRVLSARFLDPTATYGQKVTAHLWVSPASNATATLQRWTGTAWTGLKNVQLVNGVGNYTFTAVRRGTTAHRFWVPGTKAPNGLPVASTYTQAFNLHVS
jgi:hypothetical protein